jgi:hypothetical protein
MTQVRGSILKDVSATKELFTRMSYNILSSKQCLQQIVLLYSDSSVP